MRAHTRGLDVLSERTTLGPRGRNTTMRVVRQTRSGTRTVDGGGPPGAFAEQRRTSVLGGTAPVGWDNSQHYDTGTVVYNDMKYYRALRDVDPPFLPSLFDGEVPGKSDAWREISQADAISGELGRRIAERAQTILGMLDINAAQRNMNALVPVTVEIARILLRGGQEAINGAIAGAKQPWYKADLPGDTARKNVQGHLQWHATNIGKIHGVDEQTTPYAAGNDIKKWVMSAYEEGNAVEEGAAYLEDSWNTMWAEIEQKLLAIPRAAGQALAAGLKAAAGATGEGLAAGFGMPTWAFWLGGAAVVGGLGYVGYKIVRRM